MSTLCYVCVDEGHHGSLSREPSVCVGDDELCYRDERVKNGQAKHKRGMI